MKMKDLREMGKVLSIVFDAKVGWRESLPDGTSADDEYTKFFCIENDNFIVAYRVRKSVPSSKPIILRKTNEKWGRYRAETG